LDQSTTPLVDALKHCANRQNAAFYTPGHKRGQGITQKHRDLFGTAAFRADLPELPDLDNLFAPEGVIFQAQQLAAEAFGAERTWFLANGSTCGIEAAILATCGPGDKLILPRNVHSSAISGLILSGAIPVYVSPTYSAEWDMPMGVTPESIEAALQENPEAKAVLVVSPTYQGICSNLSAMAQPLLRRIATITHRHNIPLIVDEAHGPHFAFHPRLPTTAMQSGADIAVQSAHKVLSAFTQAAMLHLQGSKIAPSRLSQSLQLTQSTSPSYLLLGSLDAARYQMATAGKELMTKTLELANQAATQLKKLPGIEVLQPSEIDIPPAQTPPANPKQISTTHNPTGDPTRLTIKVSDLGLTGFEADDILHTQHNVTAELPALHTLTFIISLGNTPEDINNLIEGFTSLCNSLHGQSSIHQPPIHQPPIHQPLSTTIPLPTVIKTPRQAFFSKKKALPVDKATGHVSAETICPYPPGIPAILPGELITESAIAHLQTTLAAGGIITGCADPTLATILTTDEK